MDQFNPSEGERLKREGMSLAAENRLHLLRIAQRAALELGRKSQTLTIDDVLHYLGWETNPLWNASGSVFKGEQWERVGFVKSRRWPAHRRMIGQWRLRGDGEETGRHRAGPAGGLLPLCENHEAGQAHP